jgi:hypothetical protein
MPGISVINMVEGGNTRSYEKRWYVSRGKCTLETLVVALRWWLALASVTEAQLWVEGTAIYASH